MDSHSADAPLMSNENEEGMTMSETLMKLGNSNVISKDCSKKSHRGKFIIQNRVRSISFNFVLNPF